MARQTTKSGVEQIHSPEPTEAYDDAVAAANELAVIHQQSQANARAVAEELNYQGELSIGVLEDGVRFYQQQSVEACLQLGKCLLLLKEITPRGDFIQRAELLGINKRMAQRFMAATLKFSKATSKSLLKSVGNRTKMLELLVLDDAEIEILNSGETVRGIALDKIDTMSVSELRQSLRVSQAEHDSKDAVIKGKDDKLNLMDIKLGIKQQPVEVPGKEELRTLQDLAGNISAQITTGLHSGYVQLCEAHDNQPPESVRLVMSQSLGRVIFEAYELAKFLNITPMEEPEQSVKYGPKADAEDFMQWQKEQEINQGKPDEPV